MSVLDNLPRYYLAMDYAGENARMEESEEFGNYIELEDARRVLLEERSRLREKVEAMRDVVPFCDCGLPAACFGSGEGQEPGYMCDSCCGHGDGDGWCISIWKHLANEVLALLESREERT